MSAAAPSARSQPVVAASLTSGELVRLSRLGVWRGEDWESGRDHNGGGAVPSVQASGYGVLDAELPGGGWPVGAMSEVLLPQHRHPEWLLLGTVLGQVLKAGAQQRAVLVMPPFEVFTPVLQMSGVAAAQLCCIAPEGRAAAVAGKRKHDKGADSVDMKAVWACEQALRCRDVRAVLAWLPQAPSAALRRLQLLAAQQRQLLWVFRPEHLRDQASPAPLRLALQMQEKQLLVQILKRRGPPLVSPIALPIHHPQLQAELQAQALRQAKAQAVSQELQRSWAAARQVKETLHGALAGVALASVIKS